MTTVALVARQWMINRFSRRRLVVVAADAVADRFIVIHALQRKETARGVTGFALLRRQHVARRFRRGDNGAACIVAIGTLPERTSEYAAAMAVATAGDHVRAFQAEPRGIVIEVRVNGGLRRDRLRHPDSQHDCQQQSHLEANRLCHCGHGIWLLISGHYSLSTSENVAVLWH